MADIGVNAEKSDKIKRLRAKMAYQGWLQSLVRIELDRAEIEKRLADLKVEEDSLNKSISQYKETGE